jgi:hypothetical protein
MAHEKALWRQGRRALSFALALSLVAPQGALAKGKKPKPAEPKPKPGPSATTSTPVPRPELKAVPEPPAGPPLTVVVLPLGAAADAPAATVARVADDAVRRAKRQTLVTLADALDPTAAAARTEAGKQALNELAGAHRAYDNLDLDVAGGLCDKAYGSFLKSDLTRLFPRFVDAWLLKISALASEPKQAARVKAELSLLLPLSPDLELPGSLFSPDVIRVGDQVRADVKKAATLTLSVTSAPAGADVYLDGHHLGVTPLQAPGLAPTGHFVTVVKAGFHTVFKRANPGPDPLLDVKLEPAEKAGALEPLLVRARAQFHSAGLEPVLGQLAAALGAEQVLLLGLDPQKAGLVATAVRAQAGRVTTELEQPLATDDAAKLALATDGLVTQAVTQDHTLTGHRVPPPPPPPESSGMRYAGYGLLGGGVAAAGLGGLLGYFAHQDQAQFARTPQLDTATSNALASAGRRDGYLADGCYGAAVVAVGVGVALVVLGQPKAPPSDDAVEPMRPAEKPPEKPVERPAPAEKPVEKPAERPVEKPPEAKPEVKPKPEEKKPEPRPEEKKPEEKKPEEKKPEEKKPEPPAVKPDEPKPDAGAPQVTKPPKDLGDDIKE